MEQAGDKGKALKPGCIEVQVPSSTMQHIRSIAQEHHTNPMIVILAAYAAAAAKAVSQEHMLVNIITSGRDHPAVTDLVSCFGQILPVSIPHAAQGAQLVGERAQSTAEGAQSSPRSILNGPGSARSTTDGAQNIADGAHSPCESARSGSEGAQSTCKSAQGDAERAQSSTRGAQSSLSRLLSTASAQMAESMRHSIPLGNILEAAGELASVMPCFTLNADLDMTASAGKVDFHEITASKLPLKGIAASYGVRMLAGVVGGRRAVLFLRADQEGGLSGSMGFDPSFLNLSAVQRLIDTFQVS